MVQVVFQLDEVGAFEGDVDHAALGAGVKALSEEQRAAALEVVKDVAPHGLHIVGDDIDRFIGLHTLHDEVDNLAFNKYQYDRIDGQTNLLESDEGGEGDDGIDNHHQFTQRNFRVFVDDHRDDVAAARGGSRLENQADRDTVDDAGHDGVKEVVGHEEQLAVRNLHHIGHVGGFHDAFVDDGVVAPEGFHYPGECENQWS